MNWPADPVIYDWRPHSAEVAAVFPAVELPAWAANNHRARITLFLMVALAIRKTL